MASPVIWSITLLNAGYVPALSMWISTVQQEKVKQVIGKCVNKTIKKGHQNWNAGVGCGMTDCPFDTLGLKRCCIGVAF